MSLFYFSFLLQILKRHEKEFEQEKEIQFRKKMSNQQKLTSLKKELSAQWDHIDFNALLPESIEYITQKGIVSISGLIFNILAPFA